MGKMSAVSLTTSAELGHNKSSQSSSTKKGFPLNGILKKMENKQEPYHEDNGSNPSRGHNKETVLTPGNYGEKYFGQCETIKF